jgi:hypothetical protein
MGQKYNEKVSPVQISSILMAVAFHSKWMNVNFWPCIYQGKDIIVFRYIIEYSSLRDFGP